MCEYTKVNVLENSLLCSFIVCMHFYINLFQNEEYFTQKFYASKTTVLVSAHISLCFNKTITLSKKKSAKYFMLCYLNHHIFAF